jgi:hypothetical protein
MQSYSKDKNFLLASILVMCLLINSIQVHAFKSVFTNAFIQQQLFTYPLTSYKAGTPLIVKPSILVNGGKFSYKRISTGNGELVLNSNTGKIDLGISDSGVYEVTYKTNNNSSTVSIKLL